MTTKFPAFRSQLVFENRQEEQLPASENKLIIEHPFNYAAEVFVPGPVSALDGVRSQLPDGTVYFQAEVPLANFLRIEFIDNHLKTGKLHGITTGCGIDREDCAAVMPNGDLVLSLTKDTYNELGLEGQASSFQPGSRHTVTINLTAAHCRPGKKYYKRHLWCLSDRLQLTFSFLFTYADSEDRSAQRLSEDLGVDCRRRDTQTTCRSWRQVAVPSLPSHVLKYPARQCRSASLTEESAQTGGGLSRGDASGARDASLKEDDFMDAALVFHEWLGAMHCGIRLDDPVDSFTSSLKPPEAAQLVGECATVRWTGCLPVQSITATVTNLRSLIAAGDLPWASLCVWGFPDSPVAWRSKEHGWRLQGDNHYMLVLLPSNAYWVFATSSV